MQQALKLKRLVLIQRVINAAKRYFETHSKQEAIDKGHYGSSWKSSGAHVHTDSR